MIDLSKKIMLFLLIALLLPMSSLNFSENNHDSTLYNYEFSEKMVDRGEEPSEEYPDNSPNSIELGIDTVYNETNELRIFGDTNLATYATSGSGTEGDPYILEHYNVTTDGTTEALYLSGITAHTIVRNNILDSQDYDTRAVLLFNSQNIILENNTIINSKIAIYDSGSTGNIIRNNNFMKIDGLSSKIIQFYRTTNNIIEDLSFTNTADDGIYLADAVGTIIRNTTILDGKNGLEITRSGASYGQDNIIYNSTFFNTTSEAVIDWGYNNTFTNNTFISTNTGIWVFQGDSSIIYNNTFSDSSSAIQLATSSNAVNDTLISHNTFKNNTRGIYVLNENIQHARILNNTFIENYYGINWDSNSGGVSNNISYNYFRSNNYGMSFVGYTGVDATFNLIVNTVSIGISIQSTEAIEVLNNTVAYSGSYGLLVLLTSTTPSTVKYNDFIGNGGTGSQVIDYTGTHTVEENYYSDHTNVDTDEDGYADSSYGFDNDDYNDPTPLALINVPLSTSNAMPPIINLSNSTSLLIEYGEVGNNLVWNVTDQIPGTYSITNNSVPLTGHEDQSWTSGQLISISIDDLTLGTYEFVANFYDDFGNNLTSAITVTIQDSTNPTITESLISSPFYYYGETTELTWTATDDLPGNYSLWINDILTYSNVSWESGVQNTLDISSLGVGSHEVRIELLDSSENLVTTTYFFSIIDQTGPVIQEKPSDTISFLFSTTAYPITYNATDAVNASHYQIWVNETQQGGDFTWVNATDINLDLINYLSIKGIYNFTIIFFDDSGNSARHVIEITYGDLISPLLGATPNTTFNTEYGQEGDDITISATDANPNRFLIFLDEVLELNDTWSSGVEKTFTIPNNLNLGDHNLTFFFTDIEGNLLRFEVTVTVADTLAPDPFITPTNQQIVSGTTGNIISWVLIDQTANTYNIEVNSTLVVYDVSWTSGVLIDYNLDSLDLGVNNVTIIVSDSQGNRYIGTVFITVTDPNDPVIGSTSVPTNNEIVEGDNSKFISWTVTDSNPSNYTILQNGTEVVSNSSWASGVAITFNLEDLDFGIYNFTIILEDVTENQVVNTITISVIDTTDPVIQNTVTPDNNQIVEGDTTQSISWTVLDSNPSTYSITLNGVVITTGNWISNVAIVLNIPSQLYGEYEYVIILSDLAGNDVTSVVVLSVIDVTSPFIEEESVPNGGQVVEGDNSRSIAWTVNDYYPNTYSILQDGTQIDSGSWLSGVPIILDLIDLSYGTYNFTITFFDDSNNSVTATVIISVLDTTLPDLEDLGSYSIDFGDNLLLEWNVDELNPDFYKIFINNMLLETYEWDGSTISFLFNPSSTGSFSIVLEASDQSGNTASDSVSVEVIRPDVETTTPEPPTTTTTIPPPPANSTTEDSPLIDFFYLIFVILAIPLISRKYK